MPKLQRVHLLQRFIRRFPQFVAFFTIAKTAALPWLHYNLNDGT
jgi:hypothetical protein